MRLHHKIAAGVLIAVPMLLVPATAAFAAESTTAKAPELTINGKPVAVHEIGECKTAAKILEIIDAPTKEEQTKKLEDCYSAASPILPKMSEIFWGGIAWLIVMVGVVKFAIPALKKTMAARSEKIKSDLESAEAAKNSANAELADYRAKLADAQSEANRIIDEGRQSADGVRTELIAKAEADAAEIRSRANDEVRIASDRAMADLHQTVATLSVDLAGKIVEQNLDVATQQQLIDSYINSVGSN